MSSRIDCSSRVLLQVVNRDSRESIIEGLPGLLPVGTVEDTHIGAGEDAVAAGRPPQVPLLSLESTRTLSTGTSGKPLGFGLLVGRDDDGGAVLTRATK